MEDGREEVFCNSSFLIFPTLMMRTQMSLARSAFTFARWKRFAVTCWLLLWPFLLGAHFYPIRFGSLRALLVVGVAALWLGGAFLVLAALQRRKSSRRAFAFAMLPFALPLFTLLPGQHDDVAALRREYVRQLRAYTGTTYVWGGETRRGIDCSGLLRCAMINARVRRGLHGHPALLRAAFALWWRDNSARDFKDNRALTQRIISAQSLNALNQNRAQLALLQPGDLAVTQSGAHCLAYLGGKTWIEADPNLLQGNAVVEVTTPSRNAWFSQRVQIVRWHDFDERS